MNKFVIGYYNKSTILTHIGIIASICGICNLYNTFKFPFINGIKLSIFLLIIAGICDMFDGAIARKCKRTEKEKEFGIQLDSLADTISFVVYPIIIFLYITNYNMISIIISIFYAITGISRLAWFNIMTETNKGFYQGLPVTFSALIIPSIYTLLHILNIENISIIFMLLYILIALAFVLNFKIKKPGIKTLISLVLLAVLITILLMIY